MRISRTGPARRWLRWRDGPALRIPPGADDVENASRRFLMYGVLPLWFVPAVADWVMHRRTRIEETSGVRESAVGLFVALPYAEEMLRYVRARRGLIAHAT